MADRTQRRSRIARNWDGVIKKVERFDCCVAHEPPYIYGGVPVDGEEATGRRATDMINDTCVSRHWRKGGPPIYALDAGRAERTSGRRKGASFAE